MLMHLLLGSAAIEILVYAWLPAWRRRRYLIIIVIGGAALAAGAALFKHGAIGGVIAVVSLYRILNLARVIRGKMHELYLRHTAARTSLYLLAVLLPLAGLAYMAPLPTLDGFQHIVIALQLLTAAVLLFSTLRTMRKTRSPANLSLLADRDLPAVTVAIPVRNEMDELAECLHAVLGSDYPKLEVLVLDDRSEDSTAQVVKQFAQSGVRFLPGDTISDSWLGKNQAYEKLTRHATGSYVLFCGADVRLDPGTIRALVDAARQKRKRMISVLPKRLQPEPLSVLLQPLRYWWEVALPRRLFNRPPVLSSCWFIEREALKECGSFKAVSRSVFPEAYFAKEMVKQDGYSFMRSDRRVGVVTVKPVKEQYATAVRNRYPQLRRRPEQLLFVTALEAIAVMAPVYTAISSLWMGLNPVRLAAVICTMLLLAAHLLMITVTQPSDWWAALLTFPVLAAIDIILAHVSMWKYEFSEVEWKGRRISRPVMHAMPHLPGS